MIRTAAGRPHLLHRRYHAVSAVSISGPFGYIVFDSVELSWRFAAVDDAGVACSMRIAVKAASESAKCWIPPNDRGSAIRARRGWQTDHLLSLTKWRRAVCLTADLCDCDCTSSLSPLHVSPMNGEGCPKYLLDDRPGKRRVGAIEYRGMLEASEARRISLVLFGRDVTEGHRTGNSGPERPAGLTPKIISGR